MQDIAETMFWKMEYAKREGLEKVKMTTQEFQMKSYYLLAEGIPQDKHNKVFAGKIKTYAELKKGNANSRNLNPEAKTYTYLLELITTDESGVFNYNIDTIFI